MKVAVLGASGMLGSMLVKYLSEYFEVVATVRNPEFIVKDMPNVQWQNYDISQGLPESVISCPWVINAVGLIKQKPHTARQLNEVNAIFPLKLTNTAEMQDIHVIQIATDCVFSGKIGGYRENSPHSPSDDYGTSKSFGEVNSLNVHHLRCSIVGPEPHGNYSLLGWFLSQPNGAVINGYTNHFWNGITTLQFAKICRGLIEQNLIAFPQLTHVVPKDKCSKYQLLQYFRQYFNREDITIKQTEAAERVDRTLATNNPGICRPPTIEMMISELAEYVKGGVLLKS